MIILAYDGSLNGDWVSRYAMRFAVRNGGVLSALHVRDGSLTDEQLRVKLQRLEAESRALGIALRAEIVPEEKDVFHTLLQHIPAGPGNLVVCGTRVRTRQRRFLSGTISERLLRACRFPTLALRVVQPGLLGNPHSLLLPLSGQHRSFEEIRPLLQVFLPGLEQVYLLRCLQVGALRLPLLSPERREAMRRAGERYLSAIGGELLEEGSAAAARLDWRIAICDDGVGELLVQASRLKVHMVLLGASEHRLGSRMLHDGALERVLRDTPCDVGIYRGL